MLFYAAPIIFLAALIASALTFPWRRPDARSGLPVVILVAGPPIACVAWGQIFAVKLGAHNPSPAWWIEDFVGDQLVVSVALAAFVVIILSRARPFALSVGVASICATVVVGLGATMQINGVP
jgi:hypothetical protein